MMAPLQFDSLGHRIKQNPLRCSDIKPRTHRSINHLPRKKPRDHFRLLLRIFEHPPDAILQMLHFAVRQIPHILPARPGQMQLRKRQTRHTHRMPLTTQMPRKLHRPQPTQNPRLHGHKFLIIMQTLPGCLLSKRRGLKRQHPPIIRRQKKPPQRGKRQPLQYPVNPQINRMLRISRCIRTTTPPGFFDRKRIWNRLFLHFKKNRLPPRSPRFPRCQIRPITKRIQI